jgi:hypothetical protein
MNANGRRSVAVDDSRPPTDGHENGMNAAGSVMEAAGEWTKISRLSDAVADIFPGMTAQTIDSPAVSANTFPYGELSTTATKCASFAATHTEHTHFLSDNALLSYASLDDESLAGTPH